MMDANNDGKLVCDEFLDACRGVLDMPKRDFSDAELLEVYYNDTGHWRYYRHWTLETVETLEMLQTLDPGDSRDTRDTRDYGRLREDTEEVSLVRDELVLGLPRLRYAKAVTSARWLGVLRGGNKQASFGMTG